MTSFRNRILAAFLFGLLSLGQAYPFSVAWATPGKTHACRCHTGTPKPCGCDHGALGKRKFSCHKGREDAASSYKAAPCGGGSETAALDFRGENCLPRFADPPIMGVARNVLEDFSPNLPRRFAVPEPPPPRGPSLS